MIVIQIILSVLVILVILIQPGGKGLSKSWGGGGGGSFARRGLERLIFRSTFILLIIFVLVSIYQLTV